MQIGEKIKNYRKTAGLTQEQVADYLDVSTPAVNKWEKGNTYPDISLLPAIARLLKIDMNTSKSCNVGVAFPEVLQEHYHELQRQVEKQMSTISLQELVDETKESIETHSERMIL